MKCALLYISASALEFTTHIQPLRFIFPRTISENTYKQCQHSIYADINETNFRKISAISISLILPYSVD